MPIVKERKAQLQKLHLYDIWMWGVGGAESKRIMLVNRSVVARNSGSGEGGREEVQEIFLKEENYYAWN
jgi:hypothetical protein